MIFMVPACDSLWHRLLPRSVHSSVFMAAYLERGSLL